jgi:thiol-disulfide isomerase/thioredoxin
MNVFLASLMFLSLSAEARLTDNQVEFKIDNEAIKITTKAGFHLNAQAPASVGFDRTKIMAQPKTKTEKLFVFKKDVGALRANINFYVCDDKKTVCEKHEHTLNLKNGEAKKTEIKSTYNNIKDLNLKSADGRPTLLVFSAPWCPACVRMATETYPKKEVSKLFAKLNFVKLNSDLPENNEMSEKFKIKAIPTMVLLDKNGFETFRWLDFQPSSDFAKNLETELQKVDLSESILASAKLGDASAASALAFKAFNTLDYAEAYKWFSLTSSARDQKFKLSAEVNMAQEKAAADEKQVENYLQTLQKATVLTTSALDQIRWTLDYLDKKNELKTFQEDGKKLAVEKLKDIDQLLKNKTVAATAFKESTYGDYTGFEESELLWMKSKLLGLLENKVELEANNQKAREALLKKKLDVKRPGEMLMAIAYMREAGESKKVDELYQKLTKQYAQSYVYFEKYSRWEQKNKNFEKSLNLVNEALKYPEGNLPQLSLLKTQILKDLKKTDEALKVIDETLKESYIEHKRYAKTVKRLNELRAQLKDEFEK